MYKAKYNLTVTFGDGKNEVFEKGKEYTKEQVGECDLGNFELVEGSASAEAGAEGAEKKEDDETKVEDADATTKTGADADATTKEYDGPVANYKITGVAKCSDENGENERELEVGSIVELPEHIGDAFVADEVAEKVIDEAGAEGAEKLE